MILKIIRSLSLKSSLFLPQNLKLGATVKTVFPSPEFYHHVTAKPKATQNEIILLFEHMQVHFVLVLPI